MAIALLRPSMRGPVATCLLAAAVLPPAAAAGGIYRCERAGKPVYTDTPCAAAAQPLPPPQPSVVSAGAASDLARRYDERREAELEARSKADRDWLERHAQRKAEDQRTRSALVEGRVIDGMTPAQVRQVWGSPDEVEPRVSGGKTQERWVYRQDEQRRTVTFTDGRVTAASGKKR